MWGRLRLLLLLGVFFALSVFLVICFSFFLCLVRPTEVGRRAFALAEEQWPSLYVEESPRSSRVTLNQCPELMRARSRVRTRSCGLTSFVVLALLRNGSHVPMSYGCRVQRTSVVPTPQESASSRHSGISFGSRCSV